VFDRGELEKIFRIAKDRGIWILADECYERFLYESQPFSAGFASGRERNRWVVAGSLSKTYAMTGLADGIASSLRPAVVAGVNQNCKATRTSNPNSNYAEGGNWKR